MTRVFLSMNTAGGGGAVPKQRRECRRESEESLEERLAMNLEAWRAIRGVFVCVFLGFLGYKVVVIDGVWVRIWGRRESV